MPLIPERIGGTAVSGFAQSFWLGVAAIVFLFAALALARCIAQHCGCMGSRLSASDSYAQDSGEKRVTEVEEGNIKRVPNASMTTASPVGSHGGSNATQHASVTAGATLRDVKLFSELSPLFSALGTSYGSSGATSQLLHPYQVLDTEASVPPVFQAHARSLVPLSKRGSKSPAAMAAVEDVGVRAQFSRLLSAAQGANAHEEDHVGNVSRQTPVQQQHDPHGIPDNVVSPAALPLRPPSLLPLPHDEAVIEDYPSDRLSPPNPNGLSYPSPEPPRQQKRMLKHLNSSGERKAKMAPSSPPPVAHPPPAPSRSSSSTAFCASGGTATAPRAVGKVERRTSSRITSVPPATAVHSEEDGGEAVTTQHCSHQAVLHAYREELEHVQEELRSVLLAKGEAETARQRITDEVRDMEQYKVTLDGIIAFTLLELEDAAGGVEEAEAQVRCESALVLQRVLTAQEALRQQSLAAAS
ncbi:hypothetical protein ABL78_7839 [Leptomonas seymouri]|uniref:Uncharacterized protein n=1 Tax=Leptomonas seymouri TaxID=5684 RepID=A0A0N0P2M8_LEPSE|nr:hypothetical protein ABL78_7839 [Leptomonas seymouri]|eukprot:KPI83136.1 hypothetical protein ABL78_7839 [Leptomonas seymouri]